MAFQQDYVPYIPPEEKGQQHPFSRGLGAACQQLGAFRNFDTVVKKGLAAGADSSSINVQNHHLHFAIFCANYKEKVLVGSLAHMEQVS
jgi:hypothetical protein